jgi:hypothetical protein
MRKGVKCFDSEEEAREYSRSEWDPFKLISDEKFGINLQYMGRYNNHKIRMAHG